MVGKKGGRSMRKSGAKEIALGGMLAALAVVIMSFGGMIPSATFVCPMMCCLLLEVVRRVCGKRVAWAWYGAVAILGLLMSPDKEAAAVFVFLGYYPIVRQKLEKFRLRWLWKLVYFNIVILLMYWLLINLLGMAQLAEDWRELGTVMTIVMLLLGNVTFFMLDMVLGRRFGRRK